MKYLLERDEILALQRGGSVKFSVNGTEFTIAFERDPRVAARANAVDSTDTKCPDCDHVSSTRAALRQHFSRAGHGSYKPRSAANKRRIERLQAKAVAAETKSGAKP